MAVFYVVPPEREQLNFMHREPVKLYIINERFSEYIVTPNPLYDLGCDSGRIKYIAGNYYLNLGLKSQSATN